MNRYRATISAVLVVASFGALGMSAYTSHRVGEVSRCHAEVSEALIRAQVARAEAATLDRRADRDETAAVAALIDQVFTATSQADPRAAYAAFRARLDEIGAGRAEIERQREANPLPDPPSKTCG